MVPAMTIADAKQKAALLSRGRFYINDFRVQHFYHRSSSRNIRKEHRDATVRASSTTIEPLPIVEYRSDDSTQHRTRAHIARRFAAVMRKIRF